MNKSLVTRSQALGALLAPIPGIVDKLSTRQPGAAGEFLQWLKDSEQCLQDMNAPQASEIAAIRSTLHAQQLKSSTRKASQQVCCELLPQAQSLIFVLYEKNHSPIEEARKLLAPMLAAVAQSSAVPYNKGDDFQVFIDRIVALLNKHEQLKSSMVHVNALLQKYDCLWLIADMIDLEDWHIAA